MAAMDPFARLVSAEAENANFRGIRDYYSPEAKAVLTAWSEGFLDRDGKFLIELQTTFNSSFWELYLHAALKEMAFDVNFDHPRSDFLVCRDGKPQLTVEAAIASNPSGASKEWDRPVFNPKDWLNIDVEAVVDAATLRFSNTVASKYAKYEQEYSALAHVRPACRRTDCAGTLAPADRKARKSCFHRARRCGRTRKPCRETACRRSV